MSVWKLKNQFNFKKNESKIKIFFSSFQFWHWKKKWKLSYKVDVTLTFNLKEVKGQRSHFNMIQHLNNTEISKYSCLNKVLTCDVTGVSTQVFLAYFGSLYQTHSYSKIIKWIFSKFKSPFPNQVSITCFFLLIRMLLTSFFLFNFVLSMYNGPIWGWLVLWVVTSQEFLWKRH